jgi:hypothetical protein
MWALVFFFYMHGQPAQLIVTDFVSKKECMEVGLMMQKDEEDKTKFYCSQRTM